MGRPSLTEQRRIEICRALQICMMEKGSYEATSVKDIAQKGGMAAGLIHHYFTSKDEILLTTADIALLSVQNSLDDLLHTRNIERRRDKLHELLHDEAQSRFLLMLYSLALSMPAIRELILSKHHELEDALTARLRRSRTFTGDPAQKAGELMFLLEAAVLQSALSENNRADRLLADLLEQLFPSVSDA